MNGLLMNAELYRDWERRLADAVEGSSHDPDYTADVIDALRREMLAAADAAEDIVTEFETAEAPEGF